MRKNMLVELSGQISLDYKGIVEVVGEPPQKAVTRLARAIYSKVDASKYCPDYNHWLPGNFNVCDANPESDAPSFRATWNVTGWDIEELSSSSPPSFPQSVGGCD